MDREATVIRAEMSDTRAALDRKLALLETRAREITPRQLAQRYLPDHFAERVIGGLVTLVGVRMAWRMYRKRRQRRQELRNALMAFGRW